jgi:hypothetical protein
MKTRPALAMLLTSLFACAPAVTEAPVDPPGLTVTSPDGRVTVEFRLDAAGSPRYTVALASEPALLESKLGLVRDDADFSTGLRLRTASRTERVTDRYEILTAKRRHNGYEANRRVFHLERADGRKLDIAFQVSNDGVAFRYVFPDTSAEQRRILEEATSYRFLPGTRAWLQPMRWPAPAGATRTPRTRSTTRSRSRWARPPRWARAGSTPLSSGPAATPRVRAAPGCC